MELSPREPIVVVGASLSGLRCCEELRKQGFSSQIIVVGEEPESFYDRPPLTKQFLTDEFGEDRLELCTSDALKDLDIELVESTRAVSLDVGSHRVELDSGEEIAYSGLVVATGATPRNLPALLCREGVVTLRTKRDALVLKDRIDSGGPLVVLGAGFLGMEVAASARRRGAEVTVVEAEPTPLGRVLGGDVGEVISRSHHDHGVKILTGISLEATLGGDSIEAVRLSDGRVIPAATLLVAIGVMPETSWLQSSDLELRDGVICDAALIAGPSVVAVGDVARFPYGDRGELVRIEHWTNAAEQGAHGAKSLLFGYGSATRFESVPYFWSDQFEIKIQAIGLPSGSHAVEVLDGSFEERRFVAAYSGGERLCGALSFNSPRKLMSLRPMVERSASMGEVRDLFRHE